MAYICRSKRNQIKGELVKVVTPPSPKASAEALVFVVIPVSNIMLSFKYSTQPPYTVPTVLASNLIERAAPGGVSVYRGCSHLHSDTAD